MTVSKQIGQRAESPVAPTVPLPPTAREAGAEGEVRRPVCPPKLGSPGAGLVRNDRPRPAPFFLAVLALVRWGEEGFGAKWQDPTRRPLRREVRTVPIPSAPRLSLVSPVIAQERQGHTLLRVRILLVLCFQNS